MMQWLLMKQNLTFEEAVRIAEQVCTDVNEMETNLDQSGIIQTIYKMYCNSCYQNERTPSQTTNSKKICPRIGETEAG